MAALFPIEKGLIKTNESRHRHNPSRINRRVGLPLEKSARRMVTASSAPVRSSPALNTNMAPTVKVAVLEKPANASVGVKTLVNARAAMARIDVTSVETHRVI